ncbi:UNVERIFIED_CONTAM: hypothetical protein HDU68_011139, partial [Siphonaria sp. JEL0065]
MIGYHINKKLYTSLENHLVHLILEEALAKTTKDDKIDNEKFKRLNEFVNQDNAASDIISKLQDDDAKESFEELMESTANTKLYLMAEIPEGDLRMSIVSNLNELISCVVKYFEFYARDYYQNDSGKKFQIRDSNLPKTIKLKKDFEEIKESFETAHKFLMDTIQAVNLRVSVANGTKLERILENQLSPPTAVTATVPHTYPLRIEVMNFENNEALNFVVPDNCKTGNLVEMVNTATHFQIKAYESKYSVVPSQKQLRSPFVVEEHLLEKDSFNGYADPCEERGLDFAN